MSCLLTPQGAHGRKPRKGLQVIAVVVVLASLWLAPAAVGAAEAPMPGNYCVSCHNADDARLASHAEWQSRAPSETNCPAIKAYREDLLFTEQLLIGTASAQSYASSGARARDNARLDQLISDLGTLHASPLTSLSAFHASAQAIRRQGAKAYTGFNEVIDDRKRIVVLIAALALSALLAVFLGWGLRNTLKMRPLRGVRELWPRGWRIPVLAGLVVVGFALPIFRIPAAEVATPTTEEQAVQTALDEANRTVDVADRGFARAWMLARVGARWARLDEARADEALAAALSAEAEAQRYADALWGVAQAAQEAAVGSPAAQEEAALWSAELESVRNRAWALRLIAAEWAAVDREQAAAILAAARARAAANPTVYGRIDLAAVDAEKLDGRHLEYALLPPRALSSGASVDSARALLATLTVEVDKAEVLRFIAATTGAREDFDRALAMAEAARVRGDALAPAEASLGLALAVVDVNRDWAGEAFTQAYDLALRIPVKYP